MRPSALTSFQHRGDFGLRQDLARSTGHLLKIAEALQAKGTALWILNLGLDTTTATGKLLFTVLGAITAFEREMMLERQREGIANQIH